MYLSTKNKIHFLLFRLHKRKDNYLCRLIADVVELVDTLDLGSSAARCESSSLFIRTKKRVVEIQLFFYAVKCHYLV
jgi:hypothetical protein